MADKGISVSHSYGALVRLLGVDAHGPNWTENIVDQCLFDCDDSVRIVGREMEHMAAGYFDFPSFFAEEPLNSAGDYDRHLLARVAVHLDFATWVKKNFGDIHVIAGKSVAIKARDWGVKWNF
jgi:hypothetical protein